MLRRLTCLIVFTLWTFASAQAVKPPATGTSQPGAIAEKLVGAWQLVSISTVRPSGEEVTDWFGPKPTGVVMYQPNGYMSVQFVHDPPARWTHASPEEASLEERAAAFDGYYAYWGRYEVDATRGVVRHLVQNSLRPTEVGLTYERHFNLQGDQLTLTTTPFTYKGEQRFNKLVWQRTK